VRNRTEVIIRVCNDALRHCKPAVWLLCASVSAGNSSVILLRQYDLIHEACGCNALEGQNVQ